MNKEELHNHIKSVSEDYISKSWNSFLDLDETDLIMAGIGVGKIIASEQEKRIAELEKEIKDNEDLATVAYMRGAENQKKKSEQQLSKAKELLEDLIRFQPYIDKETIFLSIGNEWKTAIYKAEQFLKENV